MASKRFEVVTMRRTSRFTVYGVYDNDARCTMTHPVSRDRSAVVATVRELNAKVDANPINRRAEGN